MADAPVIATTLQRCCVLPVGHGTPLAQTELARAWAEIRKIEASSNEYRRAYQDEAQQAHLRGDLP